MTTGLGEKKGDFSFNMSNRVDLQKTANQVPMRPGDQCEGAERAGVVRQGRGLGTVEALAPPQALALLQPGVVPPDLCQQPLLCRGSQPVALVDIPQGTCLEALKGP